MLILLIIGFVLIVLAGIWMFAIVGSDSDTKKSIKLPIGLAIVGIVLVLFSGCIVIVNPGEVGVTTVLGTIGDNPIQPGLHLVTPFITEVVIFDTKIQTDTQQSKVLTSDALTISTDVSLLFRIDPQEAPSIYKNMGVNYVASVVDPTMRSVIRDVFATHDTKSIYSSGRSNLSFEINERVSTDLYPKGIIVDSVLLRAADPPETVTQAIEAKQKMEQQIQEKQFEVQKERAEADRKVAEAQGIANANAIISNSITPQYIEWYSITMMEKRAGDTYFIPIGSNGLPLVGNIPVQNPTS